MHANTGGAGFIKAGSKTKSSKQNPVNRQKFTDMQTDMQGLLDEKSVKRNWKSQEQIKCIGATQPNDTWGFE